MAININNIQKYHTSHNNGNGGGGGVTYVRGSVNNASLPSELNVTKISAALGNIDDLSGNSLNYNTGNFVYLNGTNGTVTKLSGQQLNYAIGTINDLSADNIRAGKITADELEATKAWIENLNSKYITTEYLTVTKQAHFFELIIDKVKSVGGTIINTAANAVLDYVKAFKEDANHQYVQTTLDDDDAAYYDVFWLAQESNGRKVTNDWMANDQAFCQSFNVTAGVNYNVSSKYYWRLVDAVLADRYMNLNTGDELPLGEQGAMPTAATENAVVISDPRIMVEGPQGATTLLEGFQAHAQQIVGIQTGAAWIGGQQGPQGGIQGVMKTTNTIFGIEIKPDAGTQAASFVPDKFALECSSSRLNVGLYFKDNTSLYYPAPETAKTHYEYDLGWIDTTGPQGAQTIKPDNSLEAIVITNADEVQWKMVHGIRLSNTVKDANVPVGPQGQQAWYANVPTAGDNIAQLGYRFTTADDPNRIRASAQILAAYKTPDTGYQTPSDPNYKAPLTPPSYAQYTDINDFHLGKHRKTFVDANNAAFVGNLYNSAGVSIEQIIGQQTSTPYYLHIAYSTSDDGRDDFTKVPVEGISYSYMGFQSNPNPSDASLIYSDYEWSWVPGGTGQQGPQGDAGPQGPQGPQGAGSVQYQLVSEGTQAGVKLGFNASNEITQYLYLMPKFRVLKIENGNASYVTGNELGQQGINGYVLIDKSEDANTRKPKYYKLSYGNSGYALLQLQNGAYTSDNSNVIRYNAMSQVILIKALASELNPTAISTTIDAYSLPIGLFPEATFSTVQGMQASIKSMVTGHQTLDAEVNGVNGIQNRLSLVEQTANGVQTTVAALTTTISDAGNLIMNGAFKKGSAYWNNWGTPTKREITTDATGNKWMHIVSDPSNVTGSNKNWQGYSQNHYTDYDITVEAGQKYTVSLMAYAGSGTPTICVGFHWFTPSNTSTTADSQNWNTWTINRTPTKYTWTVSIPSGMNHFNIMVGDNTTSVQNFYITDITLVKGSIPVAWSPAPEETDAALNGLTTEVTRISVQANGIQSDVTREFQNMSLGGANLINGTQTLNSAYTLTYGTPSLSNGISSEGLYGVIGSSTGSNVDLIKYYDDEEIAVQADTEYVMSFWAKGTGHLRTFFRSRNDNNKQMVVRPYFYNEGPQGSTGSSDDGMATFTLTNNWKRYWIKYKTLASLPTPTAYIIFGRVYESGKTAYVCGPKLEEGNIPGEWEPSVFDGHQFTSSTIKQTADDILLQVGECGINIDNHSITLNGETEINGSLTLYDDDQGFLIMDPTGAKGQTQITPKSIGTYPTFSGNANSLSPVGKKYDITMQPSSNGRVYGTWTTTNTFNNIPSGKTITLQNYNATFMIPGTGTVISSQYITNITATWQIYDNGTLRKTIMKHSLSETILDTYTKNSNGQLKIVFTVSVYISASQTQASSNRINGSIVYRMSVPQDAFTLIGYNGIGLNFGNDKTAYFGADGAYLKYGNYGIRVTSSGLQKTTNGTTWVSL